MMTFAGKRMAYFREMKTSLQLLHGNCEKSQVLEILMQFSVNHKQLASVILRHRMFL